jgi:hypothetical protein
MRPLVNLTREIFLVNLSHLVNLTREAHLVKFVT